MMKEIVALLWAICLVVVAIALIVNGSINKTVLGILLIFAIAGGLAIANYDRLMRFKGGGIDMEMAKKEVGTAVDTGIEEIKKEVKRQKDEITLLIDTANKQSEKLQKTIEMTAPPTLSLLKEKVNIIRTCTGYTAVLVFQPSKSRPPLGPISFVAKVEDGSITRIIDFQEIGSDHFRTISRKISENGEEAQFTYDPGHFEYPKVELKTSGTCKIQVLGSHISEPVFIDIE